MDNSMNKWMHKQINAYINDSNESIKDIMDKQMDDR